MRADYVLSVLVVLHFDNFCFWMQIGSYFFESWTDRHHTADECISNLVGAAARAFFNRFDHFESMREVFG